jgi:alpha-tubulin suppressor-like RCC1 family protein
VRVNVSADLAANPGVQKLVCGNLFSLVLTGTGRLLCWGYNLLGACGDGTQNDIFAPKAVPFSGPLLSTTVVVDIAAGASHSLVLTSTAEMIGWGANEAGQLGIGNNVSSLAPVRVNMTAFDLNNNITSVFAAVGVSYALTQNGTLYGAGANDFGMLARPASVLRSLLFVPIQMPIGAGPVNRVAPGRAHILVSTTDDQLFCWGSNDKGHCGVGASNTNIDTAMLRTPTPVETSGFAALKAIAAIYAMPRRCFVRTASDLVVAWGDASDFAFASGTNSYERSITLAASLPSSDSSLNDIACSSTHALAAGSSGAAYAWGDGSIKQLGLPGTNPWFASEPQPVDFATTIKIVQVEACSGRSLALDSLGNIFFWGSSLAFNISSSVPIFVDTSGIPSLPVEISCGEQHLLVRTITGQLYASGSNQYGQLGANRTSGGEFMLSGPFQSVVTLIAAGKSHSLVATGARVFSFGRGNIGQLGVGIVSNSSVPLEVTLTRVAVQFSANGDTSAAVTVDGLIYVWGNNADLQVGTSGFPFFSTPQLVIQLTQSNISSVSVGLRHMMAIAKDNQVWIWGTIPAEAAETPILSSSDPVPLSSVATARQGRRITGSCSGSGFSLITLAPLGSDVISTSVNVTGDVKLSNSTIEFTPNATIFVVGSVLILNVTIKIPPLSGDGRVVLFTATENLTVTGATLDPSSLPVNDPDSCLKRTASLEVTTKSLAVIFTTDSGGCQPPTAAEVAGGLSSTAILGAIVGGVLGGVLLLVIIILLLPPVRSRLGLLYCNCCTRNSSGNLQSRSLRSSL